MQQTQTNTPESTYTRRAVIKRGGAAGAGAIAIGTSGVATASDDPDEFAGVFGHEFEVERDTMAFARGILSGFNGLSAPPRVETLADRARNEFQANRDVWVSYGNWIIDEHGSAPADAKEIGVEFSLTRTRWATRSESAATTIDVTFENDRVDELDWRSGEPDDPDYEVELRNYAAERAADELQTFRREWIDEGGDDHELPSNEYLNELAGSYLPSVYLGSDSQSTIEVLLGEVD